MRVQSVDQLIVHKLGSLSKNWFCWSLVAEATNVHLKVIFSLNPLLPTFAYRVTTRVTTLYQVDMQSFFFEQKFVQK